MKVGRHRCGISKVTIKDVSFEITYAVGELKTYEKRFRGEFFD